jgi:hypothetical protein
VILRGRSRLQALAIAFAALFGTMLALVFLVGPLLLFGVLVVVGESPADELARGLARHYRGLAELRWLAELADGDGLVPLAILVGWTGLQVLFLSPIVGRPSPREEGRSLVPSAVAASLVATTGCAIT